jgi:hypothetical protein
MLLLIVESGIQWHNVHIKFHEKRLTTSSKVDWGAHKTRWEYIDHLSVRKEPRLIRNCFPQKPCELHRDTKGGTAGFRLLINVNYGLWWNCVAHGVFTVLMERNDGKTREAWGDMCRKGREITLSVMENDFNTTWNLTALAPTHSGYGA